MTSPFATEASIWMQNAVHLDTSGQRVEAEECYTKALLLFRQALGEASMTDADRQKLMNYMSDVAKRTQRLRAMNREVQGMRDAQLGTLPSPGSSLSPIGSPGRYGSNARHTENSSSSVSSAAASGFRHDQGGANATKNQQPSNISDTQPPKAGDMLPSSNLFGTSALAASSGDAAPPSPLAFPQLPTPPGLTPAGPHDAPDARNTVDHALTPAAASAAPAGPSARPLGVAAHFAPRTSGMVNKAIDVATQLSRQGELKRAVDVLQYAYRQGCRERNNPGNFNEIAETLKLMRQKYYARNPPRFLQDNPILPSEVELLRKSGITNTILFPLWDDLQEGYGAENIFMPCEGTWEDAFTPKLCRAQVQLGVRLEHFSEYQRAGVDYTVVREADPLHIEQGVVGDCSLVCSLMICASYQKRFPKAKIISNVIYPQDQVGNPIVNPKGKYCVKMLINGITRIVTVDDRLPVRQHSKRLVCTTSTDPGELWVPIMEKAFVKVCGGSYDFPGSVSYADLYKLSGWLPDSTSFDAPDFDSEFQWQRLYNHFKCGAVLFTVSSPKELSAESKAVGLASAHAYAVLDMQEVNDQRVVLLRNPWGKQEWGGQYGRSDTSEASRAVRTAFELTPEKERMGLFCIAYQDLVQHFDSCSLSWNPYMLFRTPDNKPRRPVRIACHGSCDYTRSTALSPQLHIGVVDAPKRSRMHLVLSRHITDVAEFGRQYDADDESTPFLALKVYDVTDYPSIATHLGGRCSLEMCYCRRIASSSDFETSIEPLNDVVYRASSARTFSFDCPAGASNLVVVVARTASKVRKPFNFSVTLHTELQQMRLPRLPSSNTNDASSLLASANADAGDPHSGVYMHMIPFSSLKHVTRVSGDWVKGKTCGGRSTDTTYVFNPQYRLHLDQPSHVSLRLAVRDGDVPCSVQLIRLPSSQPRLDSKGGAAGNAHKLVDFEGRVGNGAAAGELVLESARYSFGGAVLDSALPFCVRYDQFRALGKLKWRESKKVVVEVTAPREQTDTFTIFDVEDTDTVAVILLHAIRKGYPASPRVSRLSANGQDVSLDTSMASLFQPARSLDDTSPLTAGGRTGTSASATVTLILNTNTSLSGGDASPAVKGLKDTLGDIVADVLKCSSQLSSYVPRLTQLARRCNSILIGSGDADLRAYILEMAAYLGGYVKTSASAVRSSRTPRTLLPLLPAGDYTVIPSLWDRGVPGVYELIAETTQPHGWAPIPAEGHNLQETLAHSSLRPVSARLSSASMKPKTLFSMSDPFFENSKVQVTCVASQTVFMSRIFVLTTAGPSKEADSSSAAMPAVNLALFRVHDASSMELVCTSGQYSSGGVATPVVELEARAPYLLVASAGNAATDKYLLRIYTSGSCSVKVT